MTKFEALIACRNHWSWLAITGSYDKGSYYLCYNREKNCAVCDQAERTCIGFSDCTTCALTGFAWSNEQTYDDGFSAFCCDDENSFYIRWNETHVDENRKYYALRMVYACNQAIEDMIINGEVLE